MEQLFFGDGIKDIKVEYLKDFLTDLKDKKAEIKIISLDDFTKEP